MKKLIIYTLAHLFIITSVIAQTQNNIWSLPPNYKNGPNILPLPTQLGVNGIGLNYHPSNNNTISEHSHAAMQDVNGNLLFFVVDGIVYSKEGYYIGEFENPLINMYGGAYGNAEVLIIPNPDNCEQYYIVLTGASAPVINAGHHQNFPVYVILDLSQPNINNSSFKGNLLDLNGNPNIVNTARDLRQGLSPNWNPNPKHKAVFMAASKLRPDNTRLLFISNGSYIYRYLVDGNGINFNSYSYNLPPDGSGINFFRSEMELYEFDNGGVPNYKIAVPYNGGSEINILLSELDQNGSVIPSTANKLSYAFSNGAANVKGLEFSPNGRYLYIVKSPNSLHPELFQVYDWVTQSFISQSLINSTLLSQINNFNSSQLELSGENITGGRMYLANSSNLATIDNVDDPTNLSWNSTAKTISYNLSTRGISNPYDGVQLYLLPDQIDGMDYTDHFTANLECCIENSPYDVSVDIGNNNYSVNATWDGNNSNNNPWGWTNSPNGVTIKDKLVIKTGTNITINNMRFEFAPNAQLIVENGAKLTINGTTLTVDNRCASNVMWKGVEVWGGGPGTLQQIVAGEFVAQNNSIIEHAIEGAVNFNHAASPSNANNGGIIKATTGTTFENNAKDLVFNAYQSIFFGNPYNDRSYFSDVTFITDGSLNDPSYNNAITHVSLNDVTGISFLGCDFENTDITAATYSYLNRGIGIVAYNSKFTVDGRCVSPTFPCGSYDEGNFINLTGGISASNTTLRSQIADIRRNNFDNVWRSIYLYNMEPPKVILNDFNIGASYPLNGLESYGLYLNVCSGYAVENNNFNTTYNGYFGVYVNHSGAAPNEIYRNNFSNLKIASQAANTNGDGSSLTSQNGLEFRCNKYVNTSDYDILVSSGRVRSDQGNCFTNDPKSPANNQFSYTAQHGDYWLNDFPTVGITSTYHYSTNGTSSNLPPRAITTGFSLDYINLSNTSEQECTNLPSFNYNISCPDRQVPIIIFPPLLTLQLQYDSITNLMATKDVNLLKQLQQDLSIVKTKMEQVKNDTIRTMLEGTKNSDGKKEVISFLQQNKKYNTINDEKLLVELLIATNNISAAKSKIAEIQAIKGTKNFVDFSNIAIALNQNPIKTRSLLADTSMLEEVKIIATNKELDNSVAAATALLKSLNVMEYQEPIELVSRSKSFERTGNQNQGGETSKVSIYPNPTKEQFTLTHNYAMINGSITLTIYDLMGRSLLSELITDKKQVINTSVLKSGVYFYHITQNDKQLNSGKLIIE